MADWWASIDLDDVSIAGIVLTLLATWIVAVLAPPTPLTPPEEI
ncbi:hypothetical protein ACWGST_14075 [Agromyces sp. NPDC055520]